MNKTCKTCQHRNAQGVCTNVGSVYFGGRVDDGTCPVWEDYDCGAKMDGGKHEAD